MKKSIDIDETLAYLDKMGIPYTIDRNPSPEKIERIRASIKRSEEIAKFIAGRTK